MPYCPQCRTEYESQYTVCADCGSDLVARLPAEEWVHAAPPVVVFRASTPDEAHIAEATLKAEGVTAYVLPGDPVLPQSGNTVTGSPELNVVVPADEEVRAREVLSVPPMTDEELTAAADTFEGSGSEAFRSGV